MALFMADVWLILTEGKRQWNQEEFAQLQVQQSMPESGNQRVIWQASILRSPGSFFLAADISVLYLILLPTKNYYHHDLNKCYVI